MENELEGKQSRKQKEQERERDVRSNELGTLALKRWTIPF